MIYHNVIYIKKTKGYTQEEITFLSKFLFHSTYFSEFNLNRSIFDLLFVTRVKRSFTQDNTNGRILIFYDTQIRLTRIYSDLVQVYDSKKDQDFKVLANNDKYIDIGLKKPSKLTKTQVKYMNRLVDTPFMAECKLAMRTKKAKYYKGFEDLWGTVNTKKKVKPVSKDFNGFRY